MLIKNTVKDVPIFVMYCLKHFYINKKVSRSIFGENETSENVKNKLEHDPNLN